MNTITLRKLLFSITTGLLLAATYATSAWASGGCVRNYRVKAGDSLGKIAKRCETSVEALVLINPQIINPHQIYIGDKITIPSTEEGEELVAKAKENPQDHGILANPDPLSTGEMEKLGIEQHGREKWIDIDLGTQTLTAYEGWEPQKTFLVSTGTSRTPTVEGKFEIYVKYRKDDMRGPGYFLKDVPYTMYFHRAYGIHGTYWHDNFGVPMSHGCVNMETGEAEWLYKFASVGTIVNVHR